MLIIISMLFFLINKCNKILKYLYLAKPYYVIMLFISKKYLYSGYDFFEDLLGCVQWTVSTGINASPVWIPPVSRVQREGIHESTWIWLQALYVICPNNSASRLFNSSNSIWCKFLRNQLCTGARYKLPFCISAWSKAVHL